MSCPASDEASPTVPLAPLSDRLGHRFADDSVLTLALTHRSWCAEHPGTESNERLEFLGDAVLGLAVAEQAYRNRPGAPEGELAKVRAAVVSAPTLAGVAAGLELGRELRLGRGEEHSGGRHKPSILSDALEAVLGAVYLDGGWEAARTVVSRHFDDAIALAADRPGIEDFKTRLQERVARGGGPGPAYLVTETGPDHAKRFRAVVLVDGAEVGAGVGTSKKQAEQDAARAAWAALTARDTGERHA
jgi:ribonuclease-3